MNLYEYTGPAKGPASNPLVATSVPGWSRPSRNCYAEPAGIRALSGFSTSNQQMTGARCMAICQERGFQFAGTQWSQECWCNNELHPNAREAPASEW